MEYKYTGPRLLWRMLMVARPYWLHLAALLGISLLSTPVTLLTPVPLKIIVDHVIGTEPVPDLLARWVPARWIDDTSGLLLLAVVMAGTLGILSTIQWTGAWLLQTYTGEKLVLRLRAQLYRHIQQLAFTYHDRLRAADSTYRIQHDAYSIREVLVTSTIPFVTAVFPLVGVFAVMSVIDWNISLIALATTPALVILVRIFSGRLRKQWKAVKSRDSAAMSLVQEALSSLRVVKAYGREEGEEQRFKDVSNERIRFTVKATWIQTCFEVLAASVIGCGTAAVLYVGVRHVQQDILTLGQLLMVIAYIGRIFGPIQTMSKTSTGLASGLASAERVFSVMDQVSDITDAPDAIPVTRARGDIVFQNVSFHYVDGHPVLQNVNFHVNAGQAVGIQGRTGAGKSTLMSLLLRFYDPKDGAVLLDGVDLRKYRLQDLRQQVAIVLQDPVLFATSVRENIEYGAPGASRRAIEEAARMANAHDFIEALPEGYETLIGERGITLSGGERQRIALARAFLRDAPILILDEPTSAVDTGTEAKIIEAVNRLMKGRTTFMIAHRLSTLERCETRLHLHDGRLEQMPQENVDLQLSR
ncbi:MAG: ABC transporter ATP-binding protein [Vicinamibacterales bacterium]